ncbi:ABC transporter permease [Mycoplasmopsis synoviae]|uniref:ABC transporter permease n=1 Tax=Mycoplasmopsis synoviae TaxID=2109 RepID=UPI00036218D9|nr:ABC transporter permease [Mycoplasmopsis synoviae]AKB10969.1 peptide ABC transporter permease [Mycoplasmopsis synoviae ATCC 25204]AKJ21126.1 Oligopeptide transport system permease protein OppC [Mycoplasmopsis synoviae]AQU48469.1 Oligopeptide transport system permease protein OppC [Mycoplasmopsis synoviae]AWL84024.1 peptide ABC transporter permease [Mycoplasmopsis synoviae]QLE13755.1 ABC transporter permease [Mycoplasmopsis synoviae]
MKFGLKPTKAKTQSRNDLSNKDAPNPLLKPFAYQQWKMVGNILEYRESAYLKTSLSPFKQFLNRYSKSWSGVFGFVFLVAIFLLTFLFPLIWNDTSASNDAKDGYLQPFFKGHLLGTTSRGNDFWTLIWHGLRYSLLLSLVVTLVEVFIGVTFGILMGHFEWFDKAFTFFIKIFSVIPTIIILILVTIVINPTFWVIALALSLTGWTGMANQIRAQVKRAKNFEWISASKVLATPTYKILLSYLPVIVPILVTQLVFTIPGVILSETSLAFIGLSIPDAITLGTLINEGINTFSIYPRYVLIPASFLIVITTSVQLIGSAIQTSLLKQR